MTPNDMVYNEVYKGCLREGCSEVLSKKYSCTNFAKIQKQSVHESFSAN